jgi:hypothetical protein
MAYFELATRSYDNLSPSLHPLEFERNETIFRLHPPLKYPQTNAKEFRPYSIDFVAAWLAMNFTDHMIPWGFGKNHALIQEIFLDHWSTKLMAAFAPQAQGSLTPYVNLEVNLIGRGRVRTSDIIASDGGGTHHIIEISSNRHKGTQVRQQCQLLQENFPLIPVQGWTGAWQRSASGLIDVHFEPQYPLA